MKKSRQLPDLHWANLSFRQSRLWWEYRCLGGTANETFPGGLRAARLSGAFRLGILIEMGLKRIGFSGLVMRLELFCPNLRSSADHEVFQEQLDSMTTRICRRRLKSLLRSSPGENVSFHWTAGCLLRSFADRRYNQVAGKSCHGGTIAAGIADRSFGRCRIDAQAELWQYGC